MTPPPATFTTMAVDYTAAHSHQPASPRAARGLNCVR